MTRVMPIRWREVACTGAGGAARGWAPRRFWPGGRRARWMLFWLAVASVEIALSCLARMGRVLRLPPG